jgi:hypothetical protein
MTTFDDPRRMKAQEWADYYEERDEGKRIYDERRRGTPETPTWQPVDMRAAMKQPRLYPTIGRRLDGECLLYPGKVHIFHGESESGKTWVALFVAAQQLNAGSNVLYLDFEDDAASIGMRLVALGVPAEVVCDPMRFTYLAPEYWLAVDTERAAFEKLLERRYSLAVIDGVTEAMTMAELSGLGGEDVAAWQIALPRPIARRTGAAVVCIDHDTKDQEKRKRGPIGSQHKLSGIDGASYVVRVSDPFVDGGVGSAKLRVEKDRPGQVRKYGTDYEAETRTHLVAHFEMDSTGDGIGARLIVPTPLPSNELENEADARQRKCSCWFMEQVSRYFEDTVPEGEARTKETVINAMCEERRQAGKKLSRDWWRHAIGYMLAEGHLSGPIDVPKGKPCPLKFVTAYRMTDDPNSDDYRDPDSQRPRVVRLPKRGEGA